MPISYCLLWSEIVAKFKIRTLLTTVFLVLGASTTIADEADVMKVTVTKKSATSYSFAVTLKHSDTGWKHYANKWEVLTLDGQLLGRRVLAHPHVNEQPFTRRLNNVKIPAGTTQVEVKGYDLVHGSGGVTKTVSLP